MKKASLAFVTLSSVLLTACGGGGGGGGPSYLYYDPTTTWLPNARLTAPVNTVVATGQLVDRTPVSSSYQGFSSATLNVSLDSNADVSSISLASPYGSASFSASSVTTTNAGFGFFTATAENSTSSLVDIYKDEYMDFGYWSLYPVSGTGGYTIQFFAAGYETPSMPATGSASYSGLAVGSAYSNLDASGAITSADVSAIANFSSRNFSISSSAPAIFTLDGVFIGYENGLGFSGAGTISGSAVSGTATLVRGDSGAFSAKFYGPSANHVGGTFGFTGGDGSYIGSFGVSR